MSPTVCSFTASTFSLWNAKLLASYSLCFGMLVSNILFALKACPSVHLTSHARNSHVQKPSAPEAEVVPERFAAENAPRGAPKAPEIASKQAAEQLAELHEEHLRHMQQGTKRRTQVESSVCFCKTLPTPAMSLIPHSLKREASEAAHWCLAWYPLRCRSSRPGSHPQKTHILYHSHY